MVIELALGDLESQYKEKAGRTFSFSKGLKIVAGAAKGIAHMHTMPHPVVHRDVKGKNIMVMQDGETVSAMRMEPSLSLFRFALTSVETPTG